VASDGPAMPHLSNLDDDGKHLERWGALVAKLADAGRVETFGHPMRGGLIWWSSY
jgi:Ser/Thr protein kinase RdoA (MazF antagonist)